MGNNFLIRQEPMPRYDVVLARLEPKDNTLPGLIFGIQAAIGTVWWFCIMLVYIKNRASDADLRTVLGVPAFPVSWWWGRLTRDGDTANWLSWSLLTGFITYFMVSVMEFIAYIFYETGNLGVALWYYNHRLLGLDHCILCPFHIVHYTGRCSRYRRIPRNLVHLHPVLLRCPMGHGRTDPHLLYRRLHGTHCSIKAH